MRRLRAVFALALVLPAYGAGPAAQVESVHSPVALQVLGPRPPASGLIELDKPGTPAERPEALPVDEATWKALKAAAAADPRAPVPDELLSEAPPEAAAAGPKPTFPGIGWDGQFPPDVSIAKSPQRLIEVVNDSIFLYDANGQTLSGTKLHVFFTVDKLPIPPFDPRVIYDGAGANPRFYVVASQYRNPGDAGGGYTPFAAIHLAVSRGPNPGDLSEANWCRYEIPALDDYDAVSDITWPDYPGIGASADTLMVTSNQFTLPAPGQFTYAIVRAFRKAELSNNAAGCTGATMAVYRPAATPGDLGTLTIQPVHHAVYPTSFAGTMNPAYAVSARAGSEISYSVFRLRNTAGGTLPMQLQRTSFNGQTLYFTPPSAPQLGGGSVLIDTGRTQIHQAVGLADSLWFAHTTVCQAGGGANESCFRVVNFRVTQSAAGAPVASLGEHKTVSGGANVFYMYPAIAVNRDGRVVVAFMRSSASTYLTSLWAAKNSGLDFGVAQPVAGGACTRPAQRNNIARAGDYLGATVDPVSLSGFWVAGERAAVFPPASPGEQGTCTWDTAVLPVN